MSTTAGTAPIGATTQGRAALALFSVATELAFFAFLLLASVVSQALYSAYTSPLGLYPDEPAHYLSTLMVRDYLVAGAPGSPIAYATDYYAHYPAIAIGYWPPLFYVTGGLWMVFFGYSRISILLFGAVICAALQYVIYRSVASQFGKAPALLIAGSIPFIPVVAESLRMVMTDLMLTLMCFAATLAFGRFLAEPTTLRAVAFGVLSAGALLTKSSAAWLVFVPPLAILLSRRWSLLLNTRLLLCAAVAGAIYGPWFVISRHLTTKGLVRDFELSWLSRLEQYFSMLVLALGPWMLAAAGVGAILAVRRSTNPLWHTLAVQPLCIGLLFGFAPVHMEVRYGLMALPAVLLLACYSIWHVLQHFRASKYMAIATVPLLASILMARFPAADPVSSDLGDAMEYVAASAGPRDVILTSSGGVTPPEVLMVAEFASREPRRPLRTAIRANKALASTDWNLTRYDVRVNTPEQVLQTLDEKSVDFVVLSSPAVMDKPFLHHLLLVRSLEGAPDRWRRAFGQPGEQFIVYRRAGETSAFGDATGQSSSIQRLR